MFPPVPPIGLEYIAGALISAGNKAEILDLCFSENIFKEIDNAIDLFKPDITGITVRNIDSALFLNNEFFLNEIRDIVKHIKENYGLKVIIGGAGTISCPKDILEYLDSDFIISGPAEGSINYVLEQINSNTNNKIFYGTCTSGLKINRIISGINYNKYLEKGGIAGFETHKGCSSSCCYCIEANTKVFFKEISDVINEIKELINIGCSHFHLCDSEFNESLEYCLDFCNALKQENLNIKWTAYMKPDNFNKKLFQLMKETGAYLITLTVDTYKKCDMYWSDIERFLFSAKSTGIKVAVDLLTGFPYEKEQEIKQHLENIRRPLPESININTYIRLYKNTRISKQIISDKNLHKYLIYYSNDENLIKPVFYNHINLEQLSQIVEFDPIFRIDGADKGVNYNRLENIAT